MLHWLLCIFLLTATQATLQAASPETRQTQGSELSPSVVWSNLGVVRSGDLPGIKSPEPSSAPDFHDRIRLSWANRSTLSYVKLDRNRTEGSSVFDLPSIPRAPPAL